MSNFTVDGVYSYTSSYIYSYLGLKPSSSAALERTFNEFGVTPTGNQDDLEKLNTAMYDEYSKQVQNQIDNQNSRQVVPWAGLCAQIGIQATGNHDEDYAAFNNAIQLLSQSAIDGQAMTYFAGLRTEAQSVFGAVNQPSGNGISMTYHDFQTQYL